MLATLARRLLPAGGAAGGAAAAVLQSPTRLLPPAPLTRAPALLCGLLAGGGLLLLGGCSSASAVGHTRLGCDSTLSRGASRLLVRDMSAVTATVVVALLGLLLESASSAVR